MNSSKIILKDVSKETFKTAAKMFTYLNACTPKQLFLFYKELLTSASTKEILLALTSIHKTAKSLIKEKSDKLLSKVLEKLELIQYRNVQAVEIKGKNKILISILVILSSSAPALLCSKL